MDSSHSSVGRIIVVTRPAFGRTLEEILCQAGHEVHRTTDDGSLYELVAWLKPHLVIVTLDIPWIDNGDLVHQVQQLTARHRPVPVLVLGQVEGDSQIHGLPWLRLNVDTTCLLTMVNILLTAPHLGW